MTYKNICYRYGTVFYFEKDKPANFMYVVLNPVGTINCASAIASLANGFICKFSFDDTILKDEVCIVDLPKPKN